VSARAQRLDKLTAYPSFLDFRRPIAAAEIRQRDRLLDVEIPVEQRDDGLRDVVSDLRTPGDPRAATSCPFVRSKIRVGAMVERGRFPGWTRFATGAPLARMLPFPSDSRGRKEKSVERRAPRTVTAPAVAWKPDAASGARGSTARFEVHAASASAKAATNSDEHGWRTASAGMCCRPASGGLATWAACGWRRRDESFRR
jgi:hypothetical protein